MAEKTPINQADEKPPIRRNAILVRPDDRDGFDTHLSPPGPFLIG
jgi:hypothetical protein